MSTQRARHAQALPDILVVEDDPDHLELIKEALQDGGIGNPVRAAGTVHQARAYLTDSAAGRGIAGLAPCVIMLDLCLPDGSGLDLLQEIRRDERLCTVPVVVLTTCDDPGIVNDCYHRGANSYLIKPVMFHEFRSAVRDAGVYWARVNHPAVP